MLLIGCSMTTLAADWVKIGSTTYTMTNTATRIDADIALLDYKAQGLTSNVTANIGGTSYSGYTNVYNAVYNLLVANPTHVIPGSGGHGTNGQYIWPVDSQNDAIWYIPSGKTATFQGDDAGKVGKRLVVVGDGTIKRVQDKRRFYLTGNSDLVLCLQGQLTIDGGGAPSAALAILSVASGKVYIAGSVKIKDSHGQAALDSGGGGAITQRGGTIYMMDNAQILNCNSQTGVTDTESDYYISHGGAVALLGGTFKMMGNAKISGCTSGYGTDYPSLGGAVYMGGGSFIMNDNATIQNCTANVGGALYMKDGTFTMNGGLIGGTNMEVQWDDNSTTTYPNVNTTNYTYITDIVLNTTTVTRNEAKNAGAIYAQGGNVTLNGGVIAGNSTKTGSTQSGTLTGEDNQHNGVGISTYYGSCILMQGTAKFECNNGVTIYGNKSDGPAVFLGAGKTTSPNVNYFYGGEIKCNYCLTKYGAGVGVTTHVVANFKNDTKVSYNTTTRNGGGMLVLEGGEINLYDNVEVNHNTASGTHATNTGNGGAFRVVGSLNVYGGTISYNYARGWLEYEDPEDYTGVGGGISATSDMSGPNSSPRLANVNLEGGKMEYNKATNHGGAVYLASSVDYENTQYPNISATFNIDGTEISHNIAARDGGGCYLTAWNNGRVEVGLNEGDLKNNNASRDGGGICVAVMDDVSNPNNPGQNLINAGHSAVVTIGDNISGHVININSNTANNNGGGVTLKKGNVIMKSGNVKGNSATAHGGGIYVTGGDCEVLGGTISSNTATQNGGGIYMNGGDCTMSGGNIGASGEANTASSGGGIYTNGSVSFSNGNIQYNTANNDGGGVYISSTGSITIQGTASISGNNVMSGNGGGIYQGNVMTADGSSLTISGNTKGTAKVQTANNVYLPNNKTIKVGPSIDPTGVTLGIYTQYQAIEVSSKKIPVLTADASNVEKLNSIYEALQGGRSRMTDDRMVHQPEYTSPQTTLYFTMLTFDRDPYTKAFVGPISNVDSLYKYMCWVNGVNGFASAHPDATGDLTADISLSGISRWIPMGSNSAFVGQFNGNGHVISDLTINGIGGYANYGLFGQTAAGAEITDLFVSNINLTKSAPDGGLGAIVGTMAGGTISGCSASGNLITTATGCATGGLVGKKTGGTIHSSSAMSTMTGYTMGGLAGTNAGNIYNSYANGKFISSGTGYVGGLVGVNTGVVENCYAREQSGGSHGSTFGYLAGANQVTVSETTTKGNLNYCYAPNTPYTASSVGGNQTGVSTFTVTYTPYQYKHADNKVATVADNSYITNGALDRNGLKGLLATLNKWVKAHSGNDFSKWMRTSASPINGDYPIHNYTDYVCVGSKDNVALEYSADFNTKFKDYITANSGTIYLYQSPTAAVTSTLSNSGGVPALYIHEDVAMLHSSTIKAHVGITLDNSAGTIGAHPSFSNNQDAIDWHFFSSALTNSPIGLHYGAVGSPTEDNSTYNAYEYPDWHATFTNINGYFPLNLNDYYTDWDLYAYYEHDYHWINLKRNSASHWHEDYPGIPIPYNNDTEFVPGKGYMVALKEEGYLQAYGTLNTNTGTGSDFLTVPVSYTPEIAWTTREGHNLLGNPYQSYLDFNAFARDEQNATLWNAGRTPFYIIMDEDQADYVLYTVGQSPNESQASRFLHPHQGFMIDVDKAGNARFSNDMRTTTTTVSESGTETTWPGYFRSESNPCYPLVNLFATDGYGNRDIVTVELGRPDKGGALKQDAWRTGKGSLWCRYEDEDYALVFTQPGLEYANIRFSCDEDGEYTMTWNTQNGEFSYLHLIDNMTGADIDCLSTSEYKFSARESDYNSRFRLVFDYTGIDDHEVPEPVEGPATFAYYANGKIHLTDADDDASLQIIDMTGRTIVSRDGVHTVSTTGLAAGVYVLRLTTANGTRIQKIVLN